MRTKQRDITREKLLASAYCEIHRQGFQAASIANILQETNLTKGALYHHFQTKQALGLAVVDEVIMAQLSELIFVPLRDSDQPVQTLLDIIASLDRKAPPEFITLGCPLNNLMQEMSPLDESFKEHLTAILNAWQKAVEGALRRGQREGQVQEQVDCKAAALFIVSAWEGCVGVAKNLQSMRVFRQCMKQLHGYVSGLTVESTPGRRRSA
jgi:TetR/AcrR family transcriptional repressor of nem operon